MTAKKLAQISWIDLTQDIYLGEAARVEGTHDILPICMLIVGCSAITPMNRMTDRWPLPGIGAAELGWYGAMR